MRHTTTALPATRATRHALLRQLNHRSGLSLCAGRTFPADHVLVRASLLIALSLALATWGAAQSIPHGQPYGSIRGRVMDQVSQLPLMGAEVTIQKLPRGNDEPGLELVSVLTDAEGNFRIESLPAGRYLLDASQAGYFHHGPSARLGVQVSLEEGQQLAGITITLTPGGSISGRVTGESGLPQKGASITAMRYSYREGMQVLEQTAQAASGPEGEYRITGLDPGRYYVRVSVQNSTAKRSVPVVPLYYPTAAQLVDATALEVGAGRELTGVDLQLLPRATVTLSGRVIDVTRSAPVQNSQVTLLGDHGETYAAPNPVSTDENGRFEFRGVPSGSYVVVAQAEGGSAASAPPWGRTALDIVDAAVNDLSVTVSMGSTVSGRIRVPPSLAAEAGAMQVTLTPHEGFALDALMPPVESAAVHPDGSFRFERVPAGYYSVSVAPLPAGHYLTSADAVEVLDTGLDLRDNASPPAINLALRPAAATIRGKVGKDNCVQGAYVVLIPDGARRNQARYYKTAVSNRLGQFAMRGVVPGDYQLFAWSDLQGGEYFDPEFLRRFEDAAEKVHVDENSQVELQLESLSSTPQP